MKARALLLALALVPVVAGIGQASPLGPSRGLHLPVLSALPVHGCHQSYVHDLKGWHRHGKHCEAQRGMVHRVKRSKQKVAI